MTKEEREQMIVDNLPLIGYALNLLQYDKNKYEEYFQQGCLQLIRCVDNYDVNSGKKFSTYAVKNIKWYLKEYIQRDKIVKPPVIGKTGKVRKVNIDSLDKVVYNDGEKAIRLEDILCDETISFEESDIEFCLKELLLDEVIDKVMYEIFLERYLGDKSMRFLASIYNIRMKEVKQIINKVQILLKDKYEEMFPDKFKAMNDSYNKN